MKINERNDLNIRKPQTESLYQTPKTESGKSHGAKRLETTGDQIELGSQTGLLSLAVAVGSDDRTARVEQLRALENGIRIRVVETDYESIGVDTPEDWQRVAALYTAASRS